MELNDNPHKQTGEDTTQTETRLLHPKAEKYIQELLAEKLLLDQLKFPHAIKLIELEIEKTEGLGRAPPKENKYIELNKNKPIRVTNRVLIPVKEHPQFNFIGKILGPKGKSLVSLQEETLCRILIQGRGSMRDHKQEEKPLKSLDPKYRHLADELNIEVSAMGAPAEAHARMAYALAELKKRLNPVNTDNICIEQLEEMETNRETGINSQDPVRQCVYKVPHAATFRTARFYDTLNKARSSIGEHFNYPNRNEMTHFSKDSDNALIDNVYELTDRNNKKPYLRGDYDLLHPTTRSDFYSEFYNQKSNQLKSYHGKDYQSDILVDKPNSGLFDTDDIQNENHSCLKSSERLGYSSRNKKIYSLEDYDPPNPAIRCNSFSKTLYNQRPVTNNHTKDYHSEPLLKRRKTSVQTNDDVIDDITSKTRNNKTNYSFKDYKRDKNSGRFYK